MTDEERDSQVRKSIRWLYRVLTSGLRPQDYNSTRSSEWEETFYNFYKDNVKISELGKSTTLVEIPSADYECLLIGGNIKYNRVGYLLNVELYNSVPIELARERVQERLNKLNSGLEVYTQDYEERDENGEPVDVIKQTESGDMWSQGDNIYIPSIIPNGKALLNKGKDHYGWIRGGFGRMLSVDKDVFTLIKNMTSEVEGKCIGCGAIVLGRELCPVCEPKYKECSDCGKLSLIKDGEWRDSGFLCSECAKKPRCKGCGYPVEQVGESLCERCSKIRGILDYHSRIGRQDESNNSRLKCGIEVEKEDSDIIENLNCRAILRDTGWVVERDSSLGQDGFEMVSPIYPLNIDIIRSKIKPLEKEIGSRATNRCGGHIHVSDTERTPHEILLDIRGYLPLLYGLYPQRAVNEYCEAKETPEYIQQGHRQALNITGQTLEFRIFPAIKNIEQLLFRLRLVEYMLTHKETDVIKVGELLLNENSELYKLLRQRISKENLKIKAKAFIDFTNYLDRDALVLEGTKIRRVISIPKIKLDKEKVFEDRVKVLIDRQRENISLRAFRGDSPILESDYGYFAIPTGE